MDDEDRIILVVIFLTGMYFYSNNSISKDTTEKKYGSVSERSEDEYIGKEPSGFSLDSKTFQGHSPSSSMAWYASV